MSYDNTGRHISSTDQKNRSKITYMRTVPSLVFSLWNDSTTSPYCSIRTTKLPSISTPVRTVAPLRYMICSTMGAVDFA
jgi:hypothetical protein